jgi:hypothetical protein
MRTSCLSLCLALLMTVTALDVVEAQPQGFNYDEAKVPAYTLPELLVMQDGTKVTKAEQWPARRKEILELYQDQVFGQMPPALPVKVALQHQVHMLEHGSVEQFTLRIGNEDKYHDLPVVIFLPKSEKPVPVFLGYNFPGNHTVSDDAQLIINGLEPTDAKHARGAASSRWPINEILKRGYGVVTACYQDLTPDNGKTFRSGAHRLFGGESQGEPGAKECSAIGAWAWGLSRILDHLETDKRIDAKGVIVHGHSRLGKTSLWAGATDERISLVISNNSGEGGAAITRRRYGETIGRINSSFPHWFCGNYKHYNDQEDKLPVDAHMLLALTAPRPVYVASAEEDQWADPRGEFLGAFHAGPAYRLLGRPALESEAMPVVNKPVHTTIGYHIRTGKHDITLYDWTQYMDFADKHLGKAN